MIFERLLVLLLCILFGSGSAAVASSGQSDVFQSVTKIRGSASTNDNRKSLLEQLYGPEYQRIKAEIHKIEQGQTEDSPDYRRTGNRGDPKAQVNYKNHPYSPESLLGNINARLLQDQNATEFRPIRITFDWTALDNEKTGDPLSQTDRAIELIKTKVLPQMKTFWTEALSVVPVEGALKIQRSELSGTNRREYCGDTDFSKVPDTHINDGVSDTDLILYVSGKDSTRFCGVGTLAVAIACNWDQYDRPTAGAINFCLNTVESDSNGNFPHPSIEQTNVAVAIHEAAHVLGMSSNSFRFFRDPDTGERRTPDQTSTSQVCVDGVTRTMVFPAENTLKFGTSKAGKRYATITTPKVRTVARNQFDCQELEGAQLENQPTGSSCTGDHWDERLFYPESLSGVISPTTVILSPLTLALLEDSGWYSANYTSSNVSPWGHGVGCDFVNELCLVKDGSGSTVVPDYGKGFFCTKSSQRGCSPSHNFKMACTLKDYDLYVTQPNPPAYFQYFAPQNPGYGGLIQADYCPLYGSIYKSEAHELDCRLTENQNSLIFDQWNEKYGETSLCLETSSNTGRCYDSFCDTKNFKFGFFVNEEKFVCDYDFQPIEIRDRTGLLSSTVYCPRLSQVCPDMFCPNNCAGRGVCNFEANVVIDNSTYVRPQCECFDKNDTSVGCSESLVLNGKYIADGDALGSSKNTGFLDPLRRVFTDDPNTWSTASWIWASAIFVVFLLLVLCVFSTLCCSRNKKEDRQGPLAFTERDYGYSSPPRRSGGYSDSDYYYDRNRPSSRDYRY